MLCDNAAFGIHDDDTKTNIMLTSLLNDFASSSIALAANVNADADSSMESSSSSSTLSTLNASLALWEMAMSTTVQTTSFFDDDNGSAVNTVTETPYVPYGRRPETYIVPLLFALIFVVGVLGNGTLIVVFLSVRQMRNVPNT